MHMLMWVFEQIEEKKNEALSKIKDGYQLSCQAPDMEQLKKLQPGP